MKEMKKQNKERVARAMSHFKSSSRKCDNICNGYQSYANKGENVRKGKKRERGVVRVAPLGLNREQKMH